MTKLVAALAAYALLGCGKTEGKASESRTEWKQDPTGAMAPTPARRGGDVDRAKLNVQNLAFMDFAIWSAANPNKMCPEKIEDILEAARGPGTELKDPWGSPYQMFCGPNAPAGVRGLGIVSNGPDLKPGTADDIKSWE